MPQKVAKRIERIVKAMEDNDIPHDATTMIALDMMVMSWKIQLPEQKRKDFEEAHNVIEKDFNETLTELLKNDEVKKLMEEMMNRKDIPTV